MASVVAKKFTRRAYKILAFQHWFIVFINAIAEGFAIHFDDKKSCYWVAGIIMGTLVLFVFLEDLRICRTVLNFDKNGATKRGFYGTFNCQGLFIIIALISCLPGFIVPAAIGAVYALHHSEDGNSTSTDNSTNTDTEDKFANIVENRTIGTILSVIGAISFTIMLHTFFLHEELRCFLGIPKDGKPQTQPPLTPKPEPQIQPTPQSGASNSKMEALQAHEKELKQLKEQQNLLKEQNRLQNEQLQVMREANRRLHELSTARPAEGGSMPPPPEYETLFAPTGESRGLVPVLPHDSTANNKKY